MSDLEKIEDDFSMIERYYKHGHRLTKQQQAKVERWEAAFAILRHNKNKAVATKKYKKLMEANGVGLSDTEIYRDFRSASQLFAPMNVYSKDFLRMILTESAMKRIELNQRRARQYFGLVDDSVEDSTGAKTKVTKDLKSYETLMKLIQKDEELIMKINALDSTDPELPNFAKLEMNQITVNIDAANQSILNKILQKGSFDFNDVEDATAE